MLNMDLIRLMCQKGAVNPTSHILRRMVQRKISLVSIVSALEVGEIIEHYIDNEGDESCLILCWLTKNQPIHIVCALDGDQMNMITAYRPSLLEWQEGFKTRRQSE